MSPSISVPDVPAARPARRRVLLLLLLSLGASPAARADGAPDGPLPNPELYLERRTDGSYVSDPSRLVRVEVLSAVDGDTLRVRWEGREQRLRYFGVNTPERDRPCYDEATRRNAELAGKEVLLSFEGRPRDKHGRLLAYVFTPAGLSIDGALVAGGLGRAWIRDGRWRDGMEALQREAKAEKRGCLWEKHAKTGRSRRKRRPGGPAALK